MRIKRIAEGAVIRLASRGHMSDPLNVGDEVPITDGIHVQNPPPWPARAVEYDDEGGVGGDNCRIGKMVIG